ncbi:MAG: RsmE family RNA methyltransferase [Candidatus Omnitrophota bacterium]
MHRFYCPGKNISVDTIVIDEPNQAHHIRDVLRLKIKEKLDIFDEQRNIYKCCIKEILADKIILEVLAMSTKNVKKKIEIVIACAIPKKSKMDDIVDKLTQVGASRIIPLETERIVIKLDADKKALRGKRWEKIALSAACQSKLDEVPVIEPVLTFKDVLSSFKDYDLKLIPTLCAERKQLKEILEKIKPKKILALIGPEGDFTTQEVELAKRAGFIPISLGASVLRVETAAVAVASFLRLYYEE